MSPIWKFGGADPAGLRCDNPSRWHPRTLHRVEQHHSPPRSWTTDDGASSAVVTLCGTCHNEVHALLDLYVHADGAPPWPVLRSFGRFLRSMAAQAWADRTPGHTPYTVAHP